MTRRLIASSAASCFSVASHWSSAGSFGAYLKTIPGKPLDVGDTTKFLIVVIAGVGLSIVIGAWWFLRTPQRPEPPPAQAAAESEAQAGAVPPGKDGKGASTPVKAPGPGRAKPASGGGKAKAQQEAVLSKEEQYKANSANRTCFHAYLAFMEWAQQEGLGLGGPLLATRFQGKVSQGGVDDPAVLDLYGKFLELCSVAPESPLMPPNLTTQLKPGTGGTQQLAPEAAAKKQKLLMLHLRNLANQLLVRYGKP